MSFDRDTRNKLARMVGDARRRLVADVTDSLRRLGLQDDGALVPLSALPGLSDADKAASEVLRDLLTHFAAQEAGASEVARAQAAHARLVREIGFTMLNRLVALRMAEERGLIIESVRNGLSAAGFQLFERIANGSLGTRAEAYRAYVECLYDELAVDLPSLFSRTNPESLVFPSEPVLEQVLGLLNDPLLADLWKEDETIGWVYQYYNDPDERKKMRDASQAPRNSRELAVRNQFFTPRYVVEFLTDNTLGRTWYEMREGDTRLRDECRYLVRRPTDVFLPAGEAVPASSDDTADLSQDELLNQPVYVPFRARKDPRDLKILDPACGSGHFLLYAFDLLETIYEEAWADESSPRLGATGQTLREAYPDADELQRAVPGLILRHNLHGVDIDPRAVQIAGLALWLRAQRSYQALGLVGAARPRLTKGNLVVAEPMPGERDLLEQFVTRLDPPLIGGLVKLVFTTLQLAGEAGTLLNIEEGLRDAISSAKAVWQRGPKPHQLTLMPDDVRQRPEQMPLELDTSGISDESFWVRVEERVFAALREFGAEAGESGATKRRLFADDTERGFAFIDLCRKRFDVVVMNPPFGDSCIGALPILESQIAQAGRDIGAAFVTAANSRWAPHGFVGTLLSTAPWFKPSFARWRASNLLGTARSMASGAHLGGDVLDGATVSASATVFSCGGGIRASLFRVFRARDKGDQLRDAITCVSLGEPSPYAYLVDLHEVDRLEGKPLAYWISSGLRRRLASIPPFEGNGGSVRQGTATADEFRFARAWWEPLSGGKWIPYTKSSEYSPFWADPTWVINFVRRGEELRATGRAVLRATERFGEPGVSYPSKAVLGFNPRVHPSGSAFGHSGSVAFGQTNSPLAILGYLCSRPTEYVLSLFVGSLQGEAGFHPNHYEVGTIQKLPWPDFDSPCVSELERAAGTAVRLTRGLFVTDETAHDFVSPTFVRGRGIRAADQAHAQTETQVALDILDARACLDQIVAKSLGFSVDDLREMDNDFDERIPPASGRWRPYFGAPPGPRSESVEAAAWVSFLLGCAFGRWDMRIALDPSLAPKPTDPFAKLPVCSPGMLVGPDGLSARRGGLASEDWLRARPDSITLTPEGLVQRPTIADAEYPLRIAWDGLLVDDQDHVDDIIRKVRETFGLIWTENTAAIEQEACDMLAVSDLRTYFGRPGLFFAEHLKRYSKSRRQAPIYWPVSTQSGSYTIWIYYPRLTSDTLFTAINRYVLPKIDELARQLREARESHPGATGREASRLLTRVDELSAFLAELNELRDELKRVTELPYQPNLDDGVIINAAPLHKLFRLPKWAKDTREVWQKLERGDYDWAHMAYTIWPERVREKCRSDRSLAIAHDLEDLYCGPPPGAGRKARARTQVAMDDNDDE
jgi:hypothetical protein